MHMIHTSQQCHHCDYIHADNRQTEAKFVCLSCGHAENADLNAAKVLQKCGVKTILSTLQWELKSDQTLVAKSHIRGTRGRARGGKHKTQQPLVACCAFPRKRQLGSSRSIHLTTNPRSSGVHAREVHKRE
jgi:hypothetical protein